MNIFYIKASDSENPTNENGLK